MANRIVKVGIIGCGGIANGKHMPALKQLPGVELVAFCDIILERAEEAKAKYGTPDAKVYEDYMEDFCKRKRKKRTAEHPKTLGGPLSVHGKP